jgi:HlyD family secretion protein
MAAKRRPIPALTPLPPAPAPTRSPAAPATPLGAQRRSRRRRRWIGLVVGLALIASAGIWWQRQRMQAGRNLAEFTVVAREGSLPGVITASGELDAVQRVNVSPKRQGILLQLLVDEGDTVRKGQPLALMDDGDLRDRLMELQANVQSAESEQRRSDSELRRNEPLFRQGAISLDTMNRFRSEAEVRRLATSAARQRLRQRMVEKDELIVRAPFAGVISQRYAEPGAFVTPTTTASATAGATSSSIVELSEGLEVVAKVPESDIGRLKVGLPASVRVDAFPDRRFQARVRQIAPRAVKTNNVTSFEVKLQLDDPAPELRIGMTADIDFQTGTLQARTVVPTVAIVTEDGRPGVLLVGKRQEPTFQPVELGASSGKDTQILTGLESGTRVFIDLPPWAKKRP